jgi:hypothetical protein
VWEEVLSGALEWHHQEAGWEASPEHSATGRYSEESHDQSDDLEAGSSEAGTSTTHASGSDFPGELVDLRRDQKPFFCRVGQCLYWHTDAKQVRRHRGDHFSSRGGWSCPNRSETCDKWLGGYSFKRKDSVQAHCRRSTACGVALQATNGVVPRWGVPVTGQDLVRYDPTVHKPYQRTCGWRKHKVSR